MARLFISYKREEAAYAFTLRQWLMAVQGWASDDIFVDVEHLTGGKQWAAEIRRHAAAAEVMLFIASEASIDPQSFYHQELREARGIVLAVTIKGVEPGDKRVQLALPHGATARQIARLWDAETGAEIAVLRGHERPVLSVAFSPNGTRLATASQDQTARLWRVFPTTQALVDAAKAALPRCLTQAERAQFYLPPEPERWCVTGAGREAEPDPAHWRPLWPYHTDAWRNWLLAKDRGEEPELPGSE